MDDQDKILHFLQMTGPTIPGKVAKHIHTEILFASAHLSDLSAQGKVKISHLKIGGSPLYYLSGQEEHLFGFAQNNLNPKDFRTLQLLKEKRVLREKEQELFTKVSLRSLQDFAIPLYVTVSDKTELFWKWHLLPEEETNNRIKQMILGRTEVKKEEFEKEEVNLSEEEQIPELEDKKEEQKEQIPRIEAEKIYDPTPLESSLMQKLAQSKPVLQENKEEEEIDEKQTVLTSHPAKNISETLKESPKVRKRAVHKKETIDFLLQLETYLKELKINIEQKEVLRKNVEINLILKVPSVVGKVSYFCKAKNKAKCDDKDLSSAYLEAQTKKLPLLFLYTNDLHKKGQDLIQTGTMENVIVKKIE